MRPGRGSRLGVPAAALILGLAGAAAARELPAPDPAPADQAPVRVVCESRPGGREHCTANTAQGVMLVRSYGEAPCLLGKSWGYDDQGVWVSDGCAAEFVVHAMPETKAAPVPPAPSPTPAVPSAPAAAAPSPAPTPPPPNVPPPAGPGPGVMTTAEEPTSPQKKPPEYVPNAGFLLFWGEKGEMYLRLFSYVRYLDQLPLAPTWTDYFGNVHVVQQRQDVQLNKVFFPFSGWFLTPKFRYYLYVWSSNPSQGEPAQVVGGGNLQYVFDRHFTLGGGITSLPCVRSTEGQFPYWLGVDDRLTADEFFRGSYTTGFWLKGEIVTNLKYMAMVANNLSTLGVSAAQLDNDFNTTSFMLSWLPTTGEFGLYGTYGDYDDHQQVATRLGAHYTHSREDRQEQPGTNSIENTQIRLTDGNIIFTPDLFAPGTTIERVTYQMMSLDGGIKYKGFSLEGEYYLRRLSNFTGPNASTIAPITDHGFQLQSSAMVIPKKVQVYLSGSEIFGIYGNASEIRAGANWYFLGQRGLRLNAEWLRLYHCPVGYTAVPYPVGGTGDVFHMNAELNF